MRGAGFLGLVWVVLLVSSVAMGQYAGGTGDPCDPFQIATREHLLNMADDPCNWDKCFVLTGDIDLDPCLPGGQVFDRAVIAWDPNQIWGFQGLPFKGTFDGQDHIISNLTIKKFHGSNLGLFGAIGAGGYVKNLRILNLYIDGDDNAQLCGGVCGNNFGTIENCHAEGIIVGEDYIGGICGQSIGGVISNCYCDIQITGFSSSSNIGGICGYIENGIIRFCTSSSSFISTGENSSEIGGFCGECRDSEITSCHTDTTISCGNSNNYIGGFCGKIWHGTIAKCSAKGAINAGWTLDGSGGFCGENVFGTISQCFSNCSIGIVYPENNHCSHVGGLIGINRGIVEYCYCAGVIECGRYNSQPFRTGGFCGWNYFGTISYSYSASQRAHLRTAANGFCGDNSDGNSIISCFWDYEVFSEVAAAGQSANTERAELSKYNFVNDNVNIMPLNEMMDDNPYITGNKNGRDMPTSEMMSVDTYSYNNWAGTIWTLDNGKDYPRLAWENLPGDLIPEPEIDIAGEGTAHNPYCIRSYDDLHKIHLISYFWDKHILLETDLDLGERVLKTPLIGSNSDFSFTGIFDGNGHIIRNVFIDTGVFSWGLFGHVGSGGVVKNLGVENCQTLSSSSFIGGLCCKLDSGGMITQCFTKGRLHGSGTIGGLCASIHSGLITQCYSTVEVVGEDSSYFVGGICGDMKYGLLENCYYAGSVVSESVTSNVGPLSGRIEQSQITECYWDRDVCQLSWPFGLTTEQMQRQASFSGWDFLGEANNGAEEIWRMCADGVDYPRLAWEAARLGDFDCPDGVGLEDLTGLAVRWLMSEQEEGWEAHWDVNGDGRIDLQELGKIAGRWGESKPYSCIK